MTREEIERARERIRSTTPEERMARLMRDVEEWRELHRFEDQMELEAIREAAARLAAEKAAETRSSGSPVTTGTITT